MWAVREGRVLGDGVWPGISAHTGAGAGSVVRTRRPTPEADASPRATSEPGGPGFCPSRGGACAPHLALAQLCASRRRPDYCLSPDGQGKTPPCVSRCPAPRCPRARPRAVLAEDILGPRRVLGGSGKTRARARQEPDHLFLLPPGQGRPGNRAMRKTGSLGPPARKGRPDQLDTPGRPARPARPASATRPSAPTSPASLPARGT